MRLKDVANMLGLPDNMADLSQEQLESILLEWETWDTSILTCVLAEYSRRQIKAARSSVG